MERDFEAPFNQWNSCEPGALFDAQIVKSVVEVCSKTRDGIQFRRFHPFSCHELLCRPFYLKADVDPRNINR
jgi:hypothetical protein